MQAIKQRNASQRRPAKKTASEKKAAPKAYGAEPAPVITFEGVVELGWPLGRERIRQLTHTDPRFPPALFGGTGIGRKGFWSREKVATYFHTLAAMGAHSAEDERTAAASNAAQREASPLQAAA